MRFRGNLIGRLCAAPELSYNHEGQAYTRVRVATREDGRDAFWTLMVFGRDAEFLANYGAKGKRVVADVRLTQYQNNGNTHVVLKAQSVQLLDRDTPAEPPSVETESTPEPELQSELPPPVPAGTAYDE